MEMFRQIAPNGIVNKQIVDPKELEAASEHDEAEEGESKVASKATTSTSSKNAESPKTPAASKGESVLEKPGNAIAEEPLAPETTMTHEEMSNITPAQCPFMNKE